MNKGINSQDLLQCAADAARQAGGHVLQNIGRRREVFKSFRHDVKLQLDLEAQAQAESAIRARFPDHALLGEEDEEGKVQARSPFRWIIDPIDGTVNFSHGFPVWCCSIAVQFENQTVAGVVFAPEMNELYHATWDGPACCNRREIRVSDVDALATAMVFTGLDKKADARHAPFSLFTRIAEAVQRPRIIGSAALDLCHVAAGHGDGYFESGIYIWDIAAAGLIVERAGGRTETLAHKENHRMAYMATNGRIHDEFKKLLLAAPPDGTV